MDRENHLYWCDWGRENVDVKEIIKHFRQSHEAVIQCENYIQKEEVRGTLIHQLLDAGVDDMNIEEIIFQYDSMLQCIHFELGMKIGARLGAEYLLGNFH